MATFDGVARIMAGAPVGAPPPSFVCAEAKAFVPFVPKARMRSHRENGKALPQTISLPSPLAGEGAERARASEASEGARASRAAWPFPSPGSLLALLTTRPPLPQGEREIKAITYPIGRLRCPHGATSRRTGNTSTSDTRRASNSSATTPRRLRRNGSTAMCCSSGAAARARAAGGICDAWAIRPRV